MPDYPVIADVGQTLKELLWEKIKDDTRIVPEILGSENEITFSLPGQALDSSTTTKLSLYLYRITENAHIKNREIQNNDPEKIGYTPLGLDLFYLVTSECANQFEDHLLLGKVMQVFHDHGVVRGTILRGEALRGSADQLRLYFYSMPFEEMIQLWQSFSEKSFRLSVCYMVSPVTIDSRRESGAGRVVEKDDRPYQKHGGG